MSTGVFETVLGIPAHPLLIHAAVVFVPLMIIAGLAYAWVPGLRGRIGWAVVLLAVVAPISALFAKLSGDAFRARLVRRHLASAATIAKVDAHRHLGTLCTILAAILGLVLLVMVLWPAAHRRGWLSITMAVVTLGLGIATGYYVFRTGDTGAHIAWTGF